ncbi:flavin reductase family protein [Saccharopolyspora taberi]|uniref:Flavin reductase family protein n=1 Tax=Saccharopolyspora taberi TaxID=60895 RepID=A0ABN3VK38_9PSEU
MSTEFAVDSRAFRNVMGRFPSGVTVVTAPGADGEVHGMTANGFLSVSLDPPLILVSLAKTTRMAEVLPQSGRYGISMLADDQESHSRHFAGRPQPNLQPEFVWQHGVPLLSGALAHVACDVWDAHDAGDHTLFVGHVRHLAHREGEPLVFFTGSYRALHISPDEDMFSH